MINSLDTCLQRGYSDIFLVGGGPKSQEDKWHQTEKDTEVVVARKGTEFGYGNVSPFITRPNTEVG